MIGTSMDYTWFGCLRRLTSSALAAVVAKSGPVSICVNAASWDPYTCALGFVRQGFNGVPEVVTVTDTDRAATPSSMDWSDLGSTSSVNELVVLATWKFVPVHWVQAQQCVE